MLFTIIFITGIILALLDMVPGTVELLRELRK